MRRVSLALAMLGVCACSRSIPDPRAAVRSFARDCERGDARALHARLGSEAQREQDEAAIQAQLVAAGKEGKERCHALAHEPLEVTADATFVYASGDSATVVVEDGRAKVAAAGAMPGGGATPAAALASFRASLLRWLAGSALGPLTESSRARNRLRARALAEGLANPQALFVDVRGDRAKVEVEPGHVVNLRRENGLWRVEAFE